MAEGFFRLEKDHFLSYNWPQGAHVDIGDDIDGSISNYWEKPQWDMSHQAISLSVSQHRSSFPFVFLGHIVLCRCAELGDHLLKEYLNFIIECLYVCHQWPLPFQTCWGYRLADLINLAIYRTYVYKYFYITIVTTMCADKRASRPVPYWIRFPCEGIQVTVRQAHYEELDFVWAIIWTQDQVRCKGTVHNSEVCVISHTEY